MKFLKQIIFLTLFIMCAACSKNDDETQSSNSLNPPQWIIGEWLSASMSNEQIGFRFLSDDMINLAPNSETSLKNTINNFSEESIIEETITNEKYIINVTFPDDSSANFSFVKVDGLSIIWNTAFVGPYSLYSPEFLRNWRTPPAETMQQISDSNDKKSKK